MKSSLIPEKPILVYPSLAATVGLDESIMLSVLSEITAHAQGQLSNNFLWYELDAQQLETALPFWDRRDLQRVSTNLREKGIIIISTPPLMQTERFKFAFNEKAGRLQQEKRQPQSTEEGSDLSIEQPTGSSKNFIPQNWSPSETTLSQLARLNIPSDFAHRQVPEFVTYWRERHEAHRSWGQKFISHTLQRWRAFEEQEHRKTKAVAITSDWHPSETCIAELLKRQIPNAFILDQVQEFIRFWQATGERHMSWDNKFIQRVQTIWAEQEARKNTASQEYQIFGNWRPSVDAIEIMTTKSEIPLAFVEDAIPEFIIYWQEKGMASNTWNSLFIKHVRLQWHRYQHSLDNAVDPQPISPQWQPANDVFDILKLANIDAKFAQALVPEFILYWKERNEIHRSWNTRFLQHVKRTWASQHQLTQQNTSDNSLRSTREISLEEELNDTSWAN